MTDETEIARRMPVAFRPAAAWTAFGVVAALAAFGLDLWAPGGRGVLTVTRANGDSIAYFSTARSLIFDRDVDLSNELARLVPDLSKVPGRGFLETQPATGLPGNPFPLGYPLLALPFVALGAGVDALSGRPLDGFGPWAERLFVLANVPLLVLGLALLAGTLGQLAVAWGGEPRRARRAALLAALSLPPTTALGYYVVTAMSHAASFFATALFLAIWWRRRDSTRVGDALAVGAALGLAALCRWQGALLGIVPLVYDLGRAVLRDRPRDGAWLRSRAAGALAAAVVFLPQLALWRTVYGSFLLVPQGDDFLAWPPAHALEVLFSSSNGLFFVTPATAVGAVGLVAAARRSPRLTLPLLAAFAAQVVLVGSLPGAWHGHAFAARLLVDSLPLLAAGLCFVLLRGSTRLRAGVFAWLVLGALFTLASSVQWRLDLVPRARRLTFAEAFTDKLRIPAALPRGEAVAASRRASAADDDARAERILVEARARYGDHRAVLLRLRAVREALGDVEGRDSVDRRLAELALAELY